MNVQSQNKEKFINQGTSGDVSNGLEQSGKIFAVSFRYYSIIEGSSLLN